MLTKYEKKAVIYNNCNQDCGYDANVAVPNVAEIYLFLSFLQEELLAVLTMMVGANISPEQLLSIAERTILEADEDKDDLISFEEFAKVLERTDVEQKMSIRFLN